MRRLALALALVMTCLSLLACDSAEQSRRPGSPLDNLPDWITPLHDTGMRADWSLDGRRLIFLDGLVGNVFEIEIESRKVRPLTTHFEHTGFTRARYLSNGGVLLCGPSAEASRGEASGRWSTELFYLAPGFDTPAYGLDEPCFEGPAVSRTGMRIAWNYSEYPEKIVTARSEIWLAELEVEGGPPRLVDRRKIVDRSDFNYLAFLEVQDFRFPDEKELLFTAYAYKGGEVMGIDLDTGEITNYSQNFAYDEIEGVFPDGRFAAVERELGTYTAVPVGDIDIWKLALDGSGDYIRLTRFNEHKGFGASNPVISPDGRWMAFQLRIKGGDHGNGRGILLYDLRTAPAEP
jgi:hypothetical protein